MKAAPVDSVLALLRELVRIPSRAGEDDLAPVLACVEQWFSAQGLSFTRLQGTQGQPLGLYAEVRGRRGPGRWTVLDATLDTAGFGNLETWRHPPTAAVEEDGWLHGRGSADSKAGVALFAHLLREFAQADDFAGRFGVLFDLDEHSGRFGGAKAFFEQPFAGGPPPRPDGVIIGYPGMDRIMSGARGFLRGRICVHGVAAHSGGTRARGVNAIVRALGLAQALTALTLPADDGGFGLPPQLTLTGMQAGDEGFSQVPDRCELRLDLRLTPAFSDAVARALVTQAVQSIDCRGRGDAAPSRIEWLPGWPPYRVEDSHPLVAALRTASLDELGRELPTAVAGPSNIGNYLACLGVPALCGFGVRDEGIHAADERVALDSIAPVYRIYRAALRRLQGSHG